MSNRPKKYKKVEPITGLLKVGLTDKDKRRIERLISLTGKAKTKIIREAIAFLVNEHERRISEKPKKKRA